MKALVVLGLKIEVLAVVDVVVDVVVEVVVEVVY